jgi:MoxR-like ATPase
LADEINRAPAKVQSAIRSHAGKQVTIGDTTLNWTDLLSIGNSKPIEQEGTYQPSTGRSFYVENGY